MSDSKNTGFLLFETIHGRKHVGSSRIRGHWLINYWPEAELVKFGKKYDTLIFQKAYPYDLAEQVDSIKILDLCDPDWLDHYYVKRMADACQAITTSTQPLAEAVTQFTRTPATCVPDRVDLAQFPLRRTHEKKAEWVVWFGYSQNAEILQYALHGIQKRGLKLAVVSDNNSFRDCDRWVLHPNGSDEFNTLMQSFDIAVFPQGNRPRDKYKSNNKTLIAWANGLPVATTGDDLERFLDPGERTKEVEMRTKELNEQWDVRKSVAEMKDIIAKAKASQ